MILSLKFDTLSGRKLKSAPNSRHTTYAIPFTIVGETEILVSEVELLINTQTQLKELARNKVLREMHHLIGLELEEYVISDEEDDAGQEYRASEDTEGGEAVGRSDRSDDASEGRG